MEDGESWRNQGKLKVISLIDIALGALFTILYFYYAITFLFGFNPLPAESISPHLGRFLVILTFTLVVLVNAWQIRVAVLLFKALHLSGEDEPDSAECVPAAQRWLKTSCAWLLLIAVKFLLLTLVPLGETNNFDFFLCLLEFLFRIGGLYFVKELLDDLSAEKAAALSRAPSIRSRGPRAAPPSPAPTPPPPANIRIDIEIPLTDVETGTRMKVTTNPAYANMNFANSSHNSAPVTPMVVNAQVDNS